MSKFSDLIFEEVERLKQYGITNYSLEALCRKIDWALKIKNTYFPHLKDFVDNRNLFITALENLSDRYLVSIPEFVASSETEEFFDFLIKVVKAIKTDKESEAKKEKLNRLKKLKKEIQDLEYEIYFHNLMERK